MPLPDSFLQELVSRNDMEDVAAAYVRLKKRGRTSVGLCPFHGEKTPSFTVYPETTSFYCFGCGAGGDVISFIMRIENLGYLDAVKFLADRAGLKMPDDDVDDTVSRLRTRVLEANRAAARYFHETLYAPQGRPGLDYFYSRGYTDHTIKKFGLGYAPDGWESLTRSLHKLGYKDDELTAAFLSARSRKDPNRVYDIFRNRIMIPIIDIRGGVVAFGGRVLDDSKPKYINTSETLAFRKSGTLFALNIAKASKTGSLILCEGYMDVIALHQAGFDNAVAALGTAFTDEHARLVSRYVEEAILIFDADEAGRKGAQRAIDALRRTGVHVRIVSIPDGKDPDEYIKKNGPERFKLLLEKSAGDVEYRLHDLGRHFDLDSSDGRVAYLQKAAELLARLGSPIERDVYAGRLSAELSVNKESILRQAEQIAVRQRKQQKKQQLTQEVRRSEQRSTKANPEAGDHPRAARAEEHLLGLLLLNPDLLRPVSQSLPPGGMVTAFSNGLYQRLLDRHKQGLMVELPFLAADYDAEGMDYITHMVQQAREGPPSKERALDYVAVIREEKEKRLLGDPAGLTDDKIRDMMDALRQKKSGNRKEELP